MENVQYRLRIVVVNDGDVMLLPIAAVVIEPINMTVCLSATNLDDLCMFS